MACEGVDILKQNYAEGTADRKQINCNLLPAAMNCIFCHGCRFHKLSSVKKNASSLCRLGEVLEGVRTLAFRLLLLISLKSNLEYCDVASCGGHLFMLLQKRDLESSSGAELYKIS